MEKTGKMAMIKTPAVILEGVWCRFKDTAMPNVLSEEHLFSWWRKVWLEGSQELRPHLTIDPGVVGCAHRAERCHSFRIHPHLTPRFEVFSIRIRDSLAKAVSYQSHKCPQIQS